MDWFEIPKKIFFPRRFGNKDWHRYQRLTALLTARYLLNIGLEHFRGHHVYAESLWKIVTEKGNFKLGIPYLFPHAVIRLYNSVFGKNRPVSIPPDPWMGLPVARAKTSVSKVRT